MRLKHVGLGFAAAGLLTGLGVTTPRLSSLERTVFMLSQAPTRAAARRADQLERAHMDCAAIPPERSEFAERAFEGCAQALR